MTQHWHQLAATIQRLRDWRTERARRPHMTRHEARRFAAFVADMRRDHARHMARRAEQDRRAA